MNGEKSCTSADCTCSLTLWISVTHSSPKTYPSTSDWWINVCFGKFLRRAPFCLSSNKGPFTANERISVLSTNMPSSFHTETVPGSILFENNSVLEVHLLKTRQLQSMPSWSSRNSFESSNEPSFYNSWPGWRWYWLKKSGNSDTWVSN